MSRGPRSANPRAVLLIVGLLSFTSGCQPSSRSEVPSSRSDILFISIDTLRADHLPFYGYGRQTAPFLDSLAAEGLVFENVFVPLPATDPSHASLFTALHPVEHGVLANSMVLAERAETLAEVLRQDGYTTLGAIAVEHLGAKYNFHQGFDFYSDEVASSGNKGKYWRSGEAVNQSVFGMLKELTVRQTDEPFFLFVHYFDVHTPYLEEGVVTVEGPAVAQVVPREIVKHHRLIERYDWGIRYADQLIEELFSQLEALDLTDNLLTVVTSDHGEQLGEHGYTGGHADIYAETVRVPLLMHGGALGAGAIPRPVSSMDIPVSILEQAGLTFSNRVSGRSLFDEGQDERDLLVLGYPNYTRSLGLIDYPLWFIRNLDHVYQFVGSESIVPSAVSDESGRFEVHREDKAGGEAVYRIRFPEVSGRTALQPVTVALDVQLRDGGCRPAASIELEPHIRYLNAEDPIRFESSRRIYFQALLTDRTSVRLSPADCVEKVFYRVARYPSPWHRDGKLPNAVQSRLWAKLLTERKRAPLDEIYDLEQDPAMVRNLIDSVEVADSAQSMRRSVDRQWGGYSQTGLEREQDAISYTAEEIEMLRSLGYIQ